MFSLLAAALVAAPPSSCELDGVKAACAALSVPENRENPEKPARVIEIHYAIVAAAPGKKSDDAIFVLAGGPGQAATTLAGYAAHIFQGSGRDLVLVDARGTGHSNALHCDFGGSDEDLAGYFNDMLPTDAIARCARALEPRADFTQYTTRNIVEDVEAVRKELGYAKIDLYGSSYGTRVAQEMMRRHPENLRLVILDGVVPPSLASPTGFAENGQRSIDAVLTLCRTDKRCQAIFSELDADYRAVLKAAEHLTLTLEHPKSKKSVTVKINRGFFGEIFRNFLYSPEIYVKLPLALHSAAHGDWKIFSDLALRYAIGIRTLDFGLFLSVTCAEDVPRIDTARAIGGAKGTLLGPYRVEQQINACKLWKHGTADPDASKPVRSAIPTLLVSGEFDPVTPPKFGEEVARTLSNAAHVVVPAGSHFGDTGGCLEKILVEAIVKGSVAALDRSCVEKIERPPFELGK